MTTQNPVERLREDIAAMVEWIDCNRCTHEETHRGGAIWTICDDCGEKWADDRGGFQPTRPLPFVERVREALAALPATQPEQLVPDAERERAIVGSLEHVALWDAINAVVEASGGDAGNTSNRRQIAVVAVEKALVALMRSAPAPQPRPSLIDAINRAQGKVPWEPRPDVAGRYTDQDEPEPVPAPPASDWRERLQNAVSSFDIGEPESGRMLYVVAGLQAACDGLAALEAEVENLRSQVLP